jgi:hypothetical protein
LVTAAAGEDTEGTEDTGPAFITVAAGEDTEDTEDTEDMEERCGA